MSNDLPHACEQMSYSVEEQTLPIGYDDQFREYHIEFKAPDSSLMVIEHCPYCGVRLPASLRDEWFERVWAMHLEPEDLRVPAEMRTGRWWRDAGL